MALTYEPITSTTLGSNSASVTLSSIPSTYTDLRLVVWARSTATIGIDILKLRYNSVTLQYSYQQMYGNGSAMNASRAGNNDGWLIHWIPTTIIDGGTMSCVIFDIFTYTNTSVENVMLTRSSTVGNQTTDYQVGRYTNRSAYAEVISSLTMFVQNGNFASGSVFTLFGIKAA